MAVVISFSFVFKIYMSGSFVGDDIGNMARCDML